MIMNCVVSCIMNRNKTAHLGSDQYYRKILNNNDGVLLTRNIKCSLIYIKLPIVKKSLILCFTGKSLKLSYKFKIKIYLGLLEFIDVYFAIFTVGKLLCIKCIKSVVTFKNQKPKPNLLYILDGDLDKRILSLSNFIIFYQTISKLYLEDRNVLIF